MTTQTSKPASTRLRRPSRVRWAIFGLVWVLVVVNFIDRAALSVAMPVISKEFRLNAELKGLLLSSFFWTYLVFQLPGGWLLDRFGPRRVLTWAATVWGTFQVLGGMATGWVLLGAGRLGLGAGEAPMFPAGASLNSRWMPAKERGRAATFFDAGGPFGTAIGGLVVTGLIGLFGSWRAAFIVSGALTVLLAMLVHLYVRDDPDGHRKVNDGERELIGPTGSTPTAMSEQAAGPAPRALDYARSPSWWGLFLGRFGWALVWWGLITWTPQYLADKRGFDLAQLGWGTFAIYGAGVVGELLAGYLMDRFRARTTAHNTVMRVLLGLSGAATVLALLLFVGAASPWAAVLILAAGVFFVSFGGLYWAFPAWLAPKAQVGRVGGVMNIASGLGGVLAPIIMGYAVGSSAGYSAAFGFLTGCAVLYLVGSLLINFQRPLAVRR